MPTAPPPIPYGWSDFALMRRERSLYVDKTRFVRELENERYAFLIRPRRFGKSCWVSVLENYYDRGRKDRFEDIFGGTDIVGKWPTAAPWRLSPNRAEQRGDQDLPKRGLGAYGAGS